MSEIKDLELNGSLLRDARERAGLTQAQAAKLVGVERGTIWNFEHGNGRPSGNVLARMCAIYKCAPSALTTLKIAA